MATVKIYTTPTCAFCQMAKSYFKEKGIEYEEIDVTKDPSKVEEMIKISGQMGVPVILINGKVILGFNKGAIDDALGGL